ncbi:MAG: DUF4124 domain-containing protein [Granulosicoccus sp.]
MTYSANSMTCQALAICCLMLGTTAAQAGVYKCIDSTGNTTYSQTACPDGGDVETIETQASSARSGNCRIARNFAWRTARSMQDGVVSSQIFDQYGGINALSPTSIALINYVFTYKHNFEASVERIAQLAVMRCKVGSFGATDCDQFPVRFVDELGGCRGSEVFQIDDQEIEIPSIDSDQQSSNVPAQLTATQLAGVNPALSQTGLLNQGVETAAECRERVQLSIDRVYLLMRRSHSIDEQDRLREEKRALGKEMRRC